MMQCVITSPSTATPDSAQTTSSETVCNDNALPKRTNSDDCDLTELDLLRQIYNDICDIRRKHADIIADAASKKAENRRLLEEQVSEFKQLEAVHSETSRRLKATTSNDEHSVCDEMASLSRKYQTERDELDALRRAIDDREFQMFEADVKFDEEKESIQQELMDKEKALLNTETHYQSVRNFSQNVLSTEVEPISETSSSNYSHSDADDPGKFTNDALPESIPILHTINEITDSESDSSRFIRSLPSPIRPLPDFLPYVDQDVQFHGEDCSSADCSTNTGSEVGITTTSALKEIMRIKMLLAAAEVEKARLLHQQSESDDEGLRHETQERLQVRRNIDVDFDVKPYRHSDDVSMIQNNNECKANSNDALVLRRRNTHHPTQQVRQSRPLTRYLPVREQPLDLLRFVEEQTGHCVERCSADISVTSHDASGFLVKMGGRIRTWRRRWFVFDRLQRHLAYFVDQSEHKRPKGIIHFKLIQDVYVFDQASSVKSPAPELTFCVKTSKRTYYVVAPNTEVRQLWMEIIFTGAEGYKQFNEEITTHVPL